MEKPVKLNLIVDKSSNILRYAESDWQFVDILLSFLTLPLGSILQLTKQSMGSMNNLLKSVESLHSGCFSSEACKSMLLCPSNSASNLLSFLQIKNDNFNNLFRFCYTCSSCFSCNISFYANVHCPCGGLMDKELEFVGDSTSSNAYSSVFCNSASKFTISDDLIVIQSSVEFGIQQLSKLDIKQIVSLKLVSVDVTPENILELMKRLLVSDTPLTDVFLGTHTENDKVQLIQQPLLTKCDETDALTASTRKIPLNLYISEDYMAFVAESGNDFVDLLVGFLTYPMGAVIRMLGGQSGIQCMDNLYNSVGQLKSSNCFKNKESIEKLLNPKLPPYFKVKNQLINIDEEIPIQSYFTCRNKHCPYSSMVGKNSFKCPHYNEGNCRQLCLTDSKRGSNDEPSTGGYMKISRFMVTDDLNVMQPSSFMFIKDIFRVDSKKGMYGKKVEIGEQMALAILRASITSQNVLTDSFMWERSKLEFDELVKDLFQSW